VGALLLHRLHRYGDNIGALAMVVLFICSASTAAFMFGLQSQVQSYFVLAAWKAPTQATAARDTAAISGLTCPIRNF
jgi:hypothetical protein